MQAINKRHIPENVVCKKCGYSLHDLPENRCPECGQEFDIGDRKTYRVKGDFLYLFRLIEPPGLLAVILFAAITIGYAVEYSSPFMACHSSVFSFLSTSTCCFKILSGPFWIGYSFVLIGKAIALYRGKKPGKKTAPHYWPKFITPLLCILIVISFFFYPWPFLLRFHLSQKELQAAVTANQAGKVIQQQWVGLFFVEDVTNEDDRIYFVTSYDLLIPEPTGILYSPYKPYCPREDTEITTNWYLFSH